MYDSTLIPGRHQTHTYGRDEFGEFGSIFAPIEDFEISGPLNFDPNPNLAKLTSAEINPPIRVTHRVPVVPTHKIEHV